MRSCRSLCTSEFLKMTGSVKRWCWGGHKRESIQVAVGDRSIDIITGDMARLTSGSASVKTGDMRVLGTVVGKNDAVSTSFLPLTVNYEKRFDPPYSSAYSDILTSRVIDRSLRPLFLSGYNYEIYVTCRLLADDETSDPAITSINAASAAISLSDIPWYGPVGSVQVGIIENEIIINPTIGELEQSQLNMIVSATDKGKIVMVESSSDLLPCLKFQEALQNGVMHAQNIAASIKSFSNKVGKVKRDFNAPLSYDKELQDKIAESSTSEIKEVFQNYSHHKLSRDGAIKVIKERIFTTLKDSHPNFNTIVAESCFQSLVKKIFRDLVFESGRRCDGRELTDLRNISCKINLDSPLHGSAIFQRGQTQVFCTTVFKPPHNFYAAPYLSDAKEKRFSLNYEFPQFATYDGGRSVIGRREIGHGALAGKGLRPVIPSSYDFAINLNACVLESNGSSSMAAVCAGSLALQDAGVPIVEPVSGVAIGLMCKLDEESGEVSDHRVLTDIMGIEDYFGDMDFKMAGTKDCINALQLDTKLPGLSMNIVTEAIERATAANNQIINIMASTISKPSVPKKNRPMTEKLIIPTSKRSKFLGVGGHNVKTIMAATGVDISSIDELEYLLFAPNEAAMVKAKAKIDKILTDENVPEFERGCIYKVKIVELKDNGVIVQLHPTLSEVFMSNSDLDRKKGIAPSLKDYKVGQQISVKYFGKDPVTGRTRLSKKILELMHS